MNLFYRFCRLLCRAITLQTLRVYTPGRRSIDREGGFVLAVTHLSHLEPALVGAINHREIDWVTRKECYCNRFTTWFLGKIRCVYVNRQGFAGSTIRTGISRLRAGRVVGIFPEGGVLLQDQAVIRGGPIKRGFCSMAIRAGVPIIPCVVLGVEKLLCVKAWLPLRMSRIWVAYGEPIYPPVGCKSTRETRRQLTETTTAAFQQVYATLRERYGIRDSDVP